MGVARTGVPAVVGGACTGLMLTTAVVSPAAADSPIITVSGEQCAGQWLSGSNSFQIADQDTDDDDYCYIAYGWAAGDGNVEGRFNNPQDEKGWHPYPVNTSSHSTIYWKLCKERQSDPDICTGYRNDAT